MRKLTWIVALMAGIAAVVPTAPAQTERRHDTRNDAYLPHTAV